MDGDDRSTDLTQGHTLTKVSSSSPSVAHAKEEGGGSWKTRTCATRSGSRGQRAEKFIARGRELHCRRDGKPNFSRFKRENVYYIFGSWRSIF